MHIALAGASGDAVLLGAGDDVRFFSIENTGRAA
jgi:hypothetical protein